MHGAVRRSPTCRQHDDTTSAAVGGGREVDGSAREQFAADGVICLKEVLDAEAVDAQYEAVSWAAEPGDAVVFYQRTFHASLPNNASHMRRALGFLLLADDVTYDADHGTSDPPFREDGLVDGGAPQWALFPRLR